MTATPHNGKEEDFQLFLALIDGDRFEGRFRDGVHTVDMSDIMRRLLKEQFVKFDGNGFSLKGLLLLFHTSLHPMKKDSMYK